MVNVFDVNINFLKGDITTMKIEVFYDSLCSWCRVGKVNLHKAIDKLVKEGKIKEEDLDIVFRAYVIYPDYKPEGEDYKAIQIANDDTADWDPAKNTPIHRAAKRAGINFEFNRITVKPNTFKSHQLLYLVRDIKPEAFEPLLNDIHQAWFEDGLNISDIDVLCALAKKYVNDIYPLREKVLAGEKLEEVKNDTYEIGENKYKIDLVPLFVFDEKYTLEGAINVAEFEKALLGQPVGIPVADRKYE